MFPIAIWFYKCRDHGYSVCGWVIINLEAAAAHSYPFTNKDFKEDGFIFSILLCGVAYFYSFIDGFLIVITSLDGEKVLFFWKK